MAMHDNLPPEPPPITEQFPSTPPVRQADRPRPQQAAPQPQQRPQNSTAMARHAPQQSVALAVRQDKVTFDDRGNWTMRDETEELAIIHRLRAARAIPQSFENNDQVAYAMQFLKKRNLDPMVCIGDTGFVNGKFILYNDAPLAIVEKTGLLEYFEEFTYTVDDKGEYKRRCYENRNLHERPAGAVCVVQRRGRPKMEFAWSVQDAREARQMDKPGPWKTDLAGMLKYKARSRALKSQFASALAGGEEAAQAYASAEVHFIEEGHQEDAE